MSIDNTKFRPLPSDYDHYPNVFRNMKTRPLRNWADAGTAFHEDEWLRECAQFASYFKNPDEIPTQFLSRLPHPEDEARRVFNWDAYITWCVENKYLPADYLKRHAAGQQAGGVATTLSSLLQQDPRGDAELAALLGVGRTSIYRWRKGGSAPQMAVVAYLATSLLTPEQRSLLALRVQLVTKGQL